jgi:prevent-host-death family protein
VAILRAAAFFRNFFQSMGDQCRPGTPQQFNYMTTRAGAGKMKEIQIKDAKARLSSLIDAAMRGQAAIITRRGKRQAVLLSFKEWERLARAPSFGRLLMSAPITDANLSRRSQSQLRRVSF